MGCFLLSIFDVIHEKFHIIHLMNIKKLDLYNDKHELLRNWLGLTIP